MANSDESVEEYHDSQDSLDFTKIHSTTQELINVLKNSDDSIESEMDNTIVETGEKSSDKFALAYVTDPTSLLDKTI